MPTVQTVNRSTAYPQSASPRPAARKSSSSHRHCPLRLTLFCCYSVNLRIEGASDTVYEGVIYAGPRNVTTASGGTHLCDGTNNGANSSPGSNGISTIDAAASLCGFTYDGTFDNAFDEFTIQRIGSTAQGSNNYWGILSKPEPRTE